MGNTSVDVSDAYTKHAPPSFLPTHPSFLPSLCSLSSWWLSGEVGNISTKLSESRLVDPHLETQVDLMRHEVRSDMQRLQDLISSSKTSLYSSSLERSFRDMWVASCLLNRVVFVFVKENACRLHAENNNEIHTQETPKMGMPTPYLSTPPPKKREKRMFLGDCFERSWWV